MTNPRNRLFRQKALEHLSSPDQLDQAVQIIHPRAWIPLFALGGLVMVGGIWSVVGQLPIKVTGQGVLVNPRRMIQFQSPIAGQLKTLTVEDGQCVKQDHVLATIEPSELQQQLRQQQETLIQLQAQAQADRSLRDQRTALEQEAMATQQASLQQRLKNAQSLPPVLQTQGLTAIAQQRSSLEQQLQDARELAPVFATRLQNRQTLAQQGAISQDVLFEAELAHRQINQEIEELEAQLEQLNLQTVETQQHYVDNLSQVAQLEAELEALQTRAKQLEQENLAAVQIRDRDLQAAQHTLAQLEQQIADNSQIKSPQAGCILEITASVGQVVSPGTALGTLQIVGETNPVIDTTVLYFSVEDGKQIQPGMRVLVTPSPVKRERFGSIVGEVVSVSPFPVTRTRTAAVVGHSELADQLIGEESKIEVIAQLNQDLTTVSGYQWSSSDGPNLALTLGTTATARVVVEERAPITFLLPILREWSGID